LQVSEIYPDFRRYMAISGDIFWFFVDILQFPEIYPGFSSIYGYFLRNILNFLRYMAGFCRYIYIKAPFLLEWCA
ncbi:hypothetical protein ABE132_18160, partial [Peribacillus simplex]|uniref:hypothetical protein n=1 Tax=Peribacillus simplex TaxID=1478 RepID=UPI003D2DA5E0